MKRYYLYKVTEGIPSRKATIAKIINVFTICGNFIFITTLKNDRHFSLL